MQPERLREGLTCPPSLSLVQLAEGTRPAFPQGYQSPETTTSLVHGHLETQ